ncbi:MAG: DUF3857 domain-containing protein [Bacteroidota bacterium]
MKKNFLLLLISLPFICFGQKANDSLEFGNISPAEIAMKECDFDPNAEAVVLFDIEEVKCYLYPGSVYTKIDRHVRIKILKDKGLDEANIKLPYYSFDKTESIDDLIAQTYNVDGSGHIVVSKLDKKNVYDKQFNKKIYQKIFTFPEVKKGSIIEYSYRLRSNVSRGLQNWNFQKSIPVKLSRYTINFPADIEVYSNPVCSLPFTKDIKKSDGIEQIYSYTMNNVPALRDEPFITCDDDYVQRIESKVVAVNTPSRRINLTRSWLSVINELMEDEDFGKQLTRNIPRTDSLDILLKKVDSPYQKMATIFRYVRDKMEWNGMTSIWALDGVKSAWKDKKGTSGEINLILINLLKDAGLNASPVLVSTHDNGLIDQLTPGYGQFDNVMAYVKINQRLYVLDATDKYASPNIIPWEVNYTQGLVIDDLSSSKSWGWKNLWNENQKFNTLIAMNAEIGSDGVLKGKSNINSAEYSRSERMNTLKLGKDKFTEKYFINPNSGITIDSVVIENEKTDTLPLIQDVYFSQNLNSSGDYKYFNTNIFTGLEKNPFTADFRFSDIFFGAKQKITLVGNIILPDDYEVDELPKNTRMIMPDTSIEFYRILANSNNMVQMKTTLEFKQPFYTIANYDYFREFYQKFFSLLNEQVVIRKRK